MLQFTQKLSMADQSRIIGQLRLPYEKRIKSRLLTQLSDGTEVGVLLPRSTVMQDGDYLQAESGEVVRVVAAEETLSYAYSDDAQLLARAAYHLGNRHMVVQIGAGWVGYLHDHVLDDMVRQLGLRVECVTQPFNPEPGAYGGHAFHGGHEHHHH